MSEAEKEKKEQEERQEKVVAFKALNVAEARRIEAEKEVNEALRVIAAKFGKGPHKSKTRGEFWLRKSRQGDGYTICTNREVEEEEIDDS